MELVDYFVSGWTSIKNKFIVEIIESDSEEEEEKNEIVNVKEEETEEENIQEIKGNIEEIECDLNGPNEDTEEKFKFYKFEDFSKYTYEFQKKINEFLYFPESWEFRFPKYSEFNNNDITLIIATQSVLYLIIYNLYNYIKLFLTIFLSFFTGFSVVSYIYYYTEKGSSRAMRILQEDIEDEINMINSFEFKYDMFLNDKYEELYCIYNDDKIKNETFTNDNSDFIKSLKEKENHYELNMPYDTEIKVIIFYDDEEDGFVYYSNRSSQQYNICNSICRNYVYDKNCINLFKDEEEIDYLITRYKNSKLPLEERESINKQKQSISKQNEGSFDDLSEEMNKNTEENNAEENTEENKEENKEEKSKSVFYTKNNSNSKKENENEKQCFKINKFIYRGNMSDYELKYKEKKNSKKMMDYNDYKKLIDKIIS